MAKFKIQKGLSDADMMKNFKDTENFEDTMFNVGVSLGTSHNMVNAGVTHKFGGSRERKDAIPERYKGGPISSVYVLQDEVTALKAENARMQESLNEF